MELQCMEKKEKETEQKKQENKIKQAGKQQEYTVEEYAKVAESLFSTKPECVQAAFTFAGIQKATEEQAKKTVKSFLEMEV